MKKWILLVFIFILTTQRTLATGQASELIIYEGDTLYLLSTPLESYLGEHEQRVGRYPSLEVLCSTALWRGYVGLWKIEDSELVLIDVYLCGDRNKSILKELFGEDTIIEANWFNGDLAIQHGEELRYRHDGFARIHEQETIIEIENGNVVNVQKFVNGYLPGDSGFPSNPDSIMAKLHNMIDWNNLPELSNDLKIYVALTTGKIDSLYIVKSFAPELYVTELQRVISEFPELKKFYSRGEPLGERSSFPVVFSESQRKRFAR